MAQGHSLREKKDQASMMKMKEETQAVYQKYGVSPTGSFVQLAIQMPILFALYQVIYRIPAYVGSVKNIFTGVVDNLLAVNGYTDILQQFITDHSMTDAICPIIGVPVFVAKNSSKFISS